MTKRKIALLSACIILLCIYIIQIVTANRPALKPLTLSGEPDFIEIIRPDDKITLTKNDDTWNFTTDSGDGTEMTAEEFRVTAMINQLKNIRLLDTASKKATEIELARYELDDAHAIKVTASENGKVQRTLLIGKTSATGSQTYIMADDGNAVFLASGVLSSPFSVETENLKATETENGADTDRADATNEENNATLEFTNNSNL